MKSEKKIKYQVSDIMNQISEVKGQAGDGTGEMDPDPHIFAHESTLVVYDPIQPAHFNGKQVAQAVMSIHICHE